MSELIQSLYKKYEPFFAVGTCVSPRTLETHKELLVNHFNSLTSENHMKFGPIHPTPDTYDFTQADRMVAFAKEHSKLVRGHTLVWHNQNAPWVFQDEGGGFVGKDVLLKRMEEHINTVVSRYRGAVYCWDVVNEAVADSGPDVLRQKSPWLEIIGPEFIEKAFEYAHAADPDALLFYNDYNESQPDKRDKIYRLVRGLKEKGVPIHGIGLQAHWNIHWPSLDDIREAIEQYASLGLQLHITELDMSMFAFEDRRTDLAEPTAEMLEKQAERYEQVFALFREYAGVITNVTLWGAADDVTWLHNFPVRGRKNWPLLFDMQHKPKPALERIMRF
ncbi:MAG: endo-1,4-beta-xylanase [Limnochordia bacterium]|jgi:endo-1,4-beta-xylanase|nr:endo-1,4-beta-xylanase [Bacillota bacterium]HOB08383.1 endo-1,4-beta-xylanase [Limnochordia bacterium]NLH32087.1 endo-1,4-beta-xylanase [Bacillota bacterium]HPT92499.1 endo-1,4-beta-xylanase [Limnochordia bacterium]HPZ30593.1 endo-1,4-beta-xylanase [Limnochordia bacterium]